MPNASALGVGMDIFVHDRTAGQTSRASASSSGEETTVGNVYPGISPDGRFIGFQSNDLVPGDTNGFVDLVVHDRQISQTFIVSIATDGTQGDGYATFPVFSADGQVIAFFSGATNLVPGDRNGQADVFVHDRGSLCIASGDTNCDGIVNVGDLLVVINGWGPCPSPCPPSCSADANDDCAVDVSDLLIVINDWT